MMNNWFLLIGAALTVYGVLRLISGVWGPDARVEAGPHNALISAIIIVVGVIVLGISHYLKQRQEKA
jgi:uncharacterized membrane-anchored protein